MVQLADNDPEARDLEYHGKAHGEGGRDPTKQRLLNRNVTDAEASDPAEGSFIKAVGAAPNTKWEQYLAADFKEEVQDDIGSILVDTAEVNLTYNDGAPSITADLINDSIAAARLHLAAAVRLLGRTTAGAGGGEEISIGAGLSLAALVLSCTITQYTDELAQDAVGGALLDTSEIDFTYNDAANQISATLINDSIVAARHHFAASPRLLGRTTAAAGAGEEISVDSSLSLAALVLGVAWPTWTTHTFAATDFTAATGNMDAGGWRRSNS